jgi:putative glutamate/gamma-aminobutyrate antiporter
MTNSKKALSVFSLVMINIIAVDSLRSLPISAEYGFSLVFYYLLCGIGFLLPVALIAAELATGWPETGGIYVWLREAFGKKYGFLVVWIQWVYNVVWYPTILSLLAATLSYLIDPALAENKTYIFCMVIAFFWLATIVNLYGIHISSLISTIATIFGTMIPILFITGLGCLWYYQGKPLAITFSAKSFFPDLTHLGNLALLSSVVFGLIGLEMSAIHAGDVKNPQRDYPRAVFISAIIILSTLILGSLAIAMVIPQADIQLDSGLIEGFKVFFSAFHLPFMVPIVALLIVIGGFGTVAAWVLGPSRAIMIAARDDAAPKFLIKSNRHNAPSTVLLGQAVVVSFLSLFFIFMPSINAAFILLSTITAQLALVVYMLMFAAAIKLRYSRPDVVRKYQIPGGKCGIWLVAGLGFTVCVFIFFIGFVPPTQIQVGSTMTYESILILGCVVMCLPVFLKKKI